MKDLVAADISAMPVDLGSAARDFVRPERGRMASTALSLGTAVFAGARSPAVDAPTQTAPTRDTFYRRAGKRALDLLLCLLILPAALPLIAIAAAFLAFERNSIFYGQQRLGKDGRTFRMLKLRTMVPQADALLESCLASDPALREEWDRTQKLKNDPRITPLGRFLRRTSLDELPQLWHVLTGDMSLVGPRPMMPHQLEIYGDARSYVAVRPGITGPWQVMERNDSDFSARSHADRKYDRNVSLHYDLKLILLTFGAVVRGTGH